MKHRKFFAFSVAACAVVCAFVFPACGSKDANIYVSASGRFGDAGKSGLISEAVDFYAMDTSARLVLTDEFSKEENVDNANALLDEVRDSLECIEKSISAGIEGSCIDRFNEAGPGETVEIDEICYDVLSKSIDAYQITGGFYNPGVYYCADLYGFAPRPNDIEQPYDRVNVGTSSSDDMEESGMNGDDGYEKSQYTLPDEEYVDAFLELSRSFSDVDLYEDCSLGTFYVTKPDKTVEVEGNVFSLKIDLGGIGKGYATDMVNELMSAYGYEYGYFLFGSSSIAVMECYASDDGYWSLTYTDPRDITRLNSYLSSSIKNTSLSTSGDYEQYYEIDGVRYCHIIDPSSGRPIQTNILCCTVLGGDATMDDAYTTAIMSMGLEKAVDFINLYLKDRIAVFVYENDDGYFVICNKPDEIEIIDSKYTYGNTIDEQGNIILSTNVA